MADAWIDVNETLPDAPAKPSFVARKNVTASI